MGFLKILLIYIITFSLPAAVIFLATPGLIRVTLLVILGVVAVWSYLFSDKLILLFIGAREIIDSDNRTLFQAVKSASYRGFLPFPKIYLYSGSRFKSYVLESRGEWSIVIDRKMIENIDAKQASALVEYLVKCKMKMNIGLQTRGMCLSVSVLKCVYWFWSVVTTGPTSKAFKLFVIANLLMIKPLMVLIIKLTKIKKYVVCNIALKPIYYQVDQEVINRSFSQFISYHLEDGVSLKDLTIEFMEEFPILEKCEFVND